MQDDWDNYLPSLDHAQLTLPHASLGNAALYEVLYGTAPRTLFDWDTGKMATPMEWLPCQAAQDYMHCL